MRVPITLLVLAALMVAVRAEVPELTEAEMKLQLASVKQNAQNSNSLVRASAARDLEILPSVEAARIAVDLLGDPEAPVRFAALHSISRWENEEALRWLATQGIKKCTKAGRIQIVRALGLGRDLDFIHEAVLGQLQSQAKEIRAAAITALGNLGHREDMPTIAAYAEDREMRVREAVAIAMGTIGSSANMEEMRKLIADDEWEVRAAMIQAAGRLEIKPVVSLLVARLTEEPELRLRKNLRDTLMKLTGQDFGYDPDLWISWWNANKSEFGVTEKIEIRVEKSDYAETVEYYGIKVESSRALFVIDVSESMNKGGSRYEVTDKDGKTHVEEFENNMARARAELERVVSKLTEKTRFNIMTYSQDTEFWKPAAVWATPANRAAAIKWIQGLRGKGFTTTDTYGALMQALGAGGKSIAAAARAPQEFDSIFFLADGQPTTGITTDPEEILRDVALANPDARVEISTILLPTEGAIAVEFMTKLATQNGGRATFIEN